MTAPDEPTIQEAIQHKAKWDAHFLRVLYRLGKPLYANQNKDWIAGHAAGETEARAVETPIFSDWDEKYHNLYMTTFLATWDTLEASEEVQS